MKAKHTRRTISIIHTLFFTFLITLLIGIFAFLVWLKQGISIDELTVFDYKFEKLYIKWNKKILIRAHAIEKLTSSQNPILSLPNFNILLRLIRNTIESIDIEKLSINQSPMKIHYKDNKLWVKSAQFELLTQYHIEKSTIISDIFDMTIFPLHLHIQGDATIKKRNNFITLKTQFDIKDHAYGFLNVGLKNGTVTLDFQAETMSSINFLKHYFTISPKVSPWIFKKLQADDFTLQALHSSFNINKPKQLLMNLEVNATVNNFSYTFNPTLFPLKAKQAFITFKEGSLFIKTKDPSYHDKQLKEASISLLYLISHPYLKLSLHTHEAISEDIINILKSYRVTLPFTQTKGESNTTLALEIDLKNGKTQWDADIKVQQGELNLLGNPLIVKDTYVKVKNEQLHIYHALINEPRFNATVQGSLNLKKILGNFDINVTHLNLKAIRNQEPIVMQLLFDKKGIRLHTKESKLTLLNLYNFNISEHDFIWDKAQTLHFPNISIYDPLHLDAMLHGSLNFKNKIFDLGLDVNYLNIPLDKNRTFELVKPFVITTKAHQLKSIEANQSIEFQIGKETLRIGKFSIINAADLFVTLDKIKFANTFQANASLYYDSNKAEGTILFDHLDTRVTLTDPPLIEMKHKKLIFDINASHGLKLHSKELNLGYALNEPNTHIFYINSLNRLYPFSPLLQKFHFNTGRLSMMTQDYEHFNISASLKKSHIDGYVNPNKNGNINLNGQLFKNVFQITVNKHLQLKIAKTIEATLQGSGIDLEPYIKKGTKQSLNYPKKSTKIQKSKKITFKGKNGFIRIDKDHKLLYDHVQTIIDNNSIYANLKYKKGQAILFFENNNIELFGENFNDRFLHALINFDGLLGGHYDFYFQGDNHYLMGGIKIKNATAKGFEVYNNLLAYFNTIPALLTLKSPGFDDKGLRIKNGDILFEKKEEILSLKTIKLYGDSTNIFGSGTIDLKRKKINLALRIFLIKDMGTIISKIPIAGYLLLGDDGSLTTTITITGDLNHPKFGVDLAKDLVMAPINIIKRTLNLPTKILNWLQGK